MSSPTASAAGARASRIIAPVASATAFAVTTQPMRSFASFAFAIMTHVFVASGFHVFIYVIKCINK
jgi:hypothetical protein